jgi:hypothetical protein
LRIVQLNQVRRCRDRDVVLVGGKRSSDQVRSARLVAGVRRAIVFPKRMSQQAAGRPD